MAFERPVLAAFGAESMESFIFWTLFNVVILHYFNFYRLNRAVFAKTGTRDELRSSWSAVRSCTGAVLL